MKSFMALSYDRAMKRLIHSILHMGDAPWRMLQATCIASCLMVFAGCVLLFQAGPASFANFELYRMARALGEAPAGLLLLGGIATVILEFEK